MVLNHINLTVTNAMETQEFLAKYFEMKPMGKPSPKMAFLTDENGMILSMFSAPNVTYPETFHIGFAQKSPEKVNEIYGLLKADGYEVDAPSRMHGSWTFYFRAPGGFTIEVLC
jgi:lactoylglutathione lyase